jgi:CRISPR-associated endoribonuclease Cas6
MLLPPPESNALHSLVIQLAAASKKALPRTLGRALHAQVMQWISLGNPYLAEAIHNSQDSPLSLSGLLGHRRQSGTKPGDDFYFRVALLHGDLLAPLLSGLEQWGTKPLSLGQCPLIIRSIDSMPGTHPWVGSSDYALLARTPKISDDITLNFLSPTSFKQRQDIQPFPLPELVFGSLLRRWNTFAPVELQFPVVEWQGLSSAYELKTQALKMEGGAEIGAAGWVRYRFPDPEQLKIATVLAHFAFFSGVGRKTAMGMGQTRLSTKSWQ